MKLKLTLNGEPKTFEIEPGDRLSDLLRREGFHGVKVGCSTGDCGTCTILLNGLPVLSCLMLAAQAAGESITTVEGLAPQDELHPLQIAFLDEGAVQCGFCTPGMLLSSFALLEENDSPSDSEIRESLSGNLCRCTGYENPVRAVRNAARKMRGES